MQGISTATSPDTPRPASPSNHATAATTAPSTTAAAHIRHIGNVPRPQSLHLHAIPHLESTLQCAVDAYRDHTRALSQSPCYLTDILARSEALRAQITAAMKAAIEDPRSNVGKDEAARILTRIDKVLCVEEVTLTLRAADAVAAKAAEAAAGTAASPDPFTDNPVPTDISTVLDTMVREAAQAHTKALLPLLGTDYSERDVAAASLTLRDELATAFRASVASLPRSATGKPLARLERELTTRHGDALGRREVAVQEAQAALGLEHALAKDAAEEAAATPPAHSEHIPGAATMKLTTLVPGMPDLQTLAPLPTVAEQAERISTAIKHRFDATVADCKAGRLDTQAGNEQGWTVAVRAIRAAARTGSTDTAALTRATVDVAADHFVRLRETLRGTPYSPEQRDHMRAQMHVELQKVAARHTTEPSGR